MTLIEFKQCAPIAQEVERMRSLMEHLKVDEIKRTLLVLDVHGVKY